MEREGMVGRGIVHFLCLALPLLTLATSCKGNPQPDVPTEQPRLRVLGYVFAADWALAKTQVNWQQITDLNIAFLNPDANGVFEAGAGLEGLVQRAHDHDVRVFFSIGGGSPPPHLETLLQTKPQRAKLVLGIVDLINRYGFDGVDIDLENALINAHYAPFVEEVAAAVKPLDKLVTAALASWNADQIADETLAHYDFINVMSYDATGPWNPSNGGPHSPYAMATHDFEYFHKTRNIPAEKIFTGLPFYGYGFGEGAPESLFFRDIVARWPGSEQHDEVTLPAGGTVYYNGIPTIRKKTQYAMDKGAGGVMIWQLLQDAEGDKSLLRAINETIN